MVDMPGILVVDDDAAALKLADAAVRELGYRTVAKANAEDALLAAAADPPALAIVDLLTPGVDGFEFISRLRATPAGRHVPIVVWTVKDLTEEERAFLRASAQAIVHKGQGGSGVLAELEAVVRRPPLPA